MKLELKIRKIHYCFLFHYLNLNDILETYKNGGGTRWRSWFEELRYNPEGREFDSRWCHWKFSFIESFRPHYGPGVDSNSNINEY